MTLTIDLTPEEETRLKEEATRLHMEPTEYVRKIIDLAKDSRFGLISQFLDILQAVDPIRDSIGNQLDADLIDTTEDISPEELNRRFIAWVESHNDWPELPPESYNKEILYEDRF